MSGAVIPMKRRNLESQLLSKLLEQRVDAQLTLDTYNISPKLFGYYKVEVECYINYLKKYHETIELTTLMNHVMTDDGDESDFKYSSQANTSIKALVDELREFCKRELLNQVLNTFDIGEGEAEAALEQLYQNTSQQLTSIGKKHHTTLSDKEEYDKVCEEANSLLKGEFVTGFPEVDTAFTAKGMTAKELVVFKSRSGNCKTFTLVRLIVENLKRGVRCYVLSPELAKDEFLYRVLITLYGGVGFDFSSASKRFFDEYQKDKKLLEIEEGEELGRFSLDSIKRKALDIKAQLIVIDGLRYLVDPYSKISVPDQYGINCFNLLAFSKTYRIPVVVCVQENRSEGSLKVGNISGSDQIAHTATAIFGIKKDVVGGSQRIAFTTEKMRKGKEALTFTYDWTYNNNSFTYVSCEQGYGRNTQPFEIEGPVLSEVLVNYSQNNPAGDMKVLDWG